MSEHSKPYHGPHVVLSREEIERLHSIMSEYWDHPTYRFVDDSIRSKLDAVLKSHPDFLQPAK